MSITRRAILKSTAALTATSALQMSLGLNVWANTSMSLGQKKVDVLSDGHLRLPANFLFSDLAVTDINPILQRYGLPTDTLEPDCNLTLIRDGERTILFDVGCRFCDCVALCLAPALLLPGRPLRPPSASSCCPRCGPCARVRRSRVGKLPHRAVPTEPFLFGDRDWISRAILCTCANTNVSCGQ